MSLAQLAEQAASPLRPSLMPGAFFPGWNVGNPLRKGWDGTRGQSTRVSYVNRFGALARGDVFAPLPGARDPYSGRRLRPPYPGVVITTGSVQGSERMYWSQQEANFTKGTIDALDFLLSTPGKPYAGKGGEDASPNAFNPLFKLLDRRRDPRAETPGRTTRVAIVGHSLGASAVSKVQGTDERVAAVVALDKPNAGEGVTPKVPALAVQSEYGFTVSPWFLSGGSSIAPQPGSPSAAPDPRRERATGFDAWREAGVDAMLVVPRASTHLEYTDIPLALPASRYGQALTSVYVQAWLDRWLKHRSAAPLLRGEHRYLEPVGGGRWEPVALRRDELLSFYYCSAHAFRDSARPPRAHTADDVAGVGGCERSAG